MLFLGAASIQGTIQFTGIALHRLHCATYSVYRCNIHLLHSCKPCVLNYVRLTTERSQSLHTTLMTLHFQKHYIFQSTSKAVHISAHPKGNASLRLAGKEGKLPPTSLGCCLQGWVSPAVETNKAKLTQPRKQGKATANLVEIDCTC